jgi:hypothetical protein
MFRIVVCIALLLGIVSSSAQPVNPLSAPSPWPDLRQNSGGPPSCVFGNTLGPGNTPAYFCAVIIHSLTDEADPSVRRVGQGGVAGILVNPTTGDVTPTTSQTMDPTTGLTFSTNVVLLPHPPSAVGCVLIDDAPSCLFYTYKTTNDNDIGVLSLSGVVLSISDPPPPAQPAIEQPPALTTFISNFSCVGNTCFVIDAGARIRQWTRPPGTFAWKTPQDVSLPDFASPHLALSSSSTSALSCTSSTPAGSPVPKIDCFSRSTVSYLSFEPLNLVRASTDGSTPFTAHGGLTWTTMPIVVGDSSLRIGGTGPECLSAVSGASDCFFGFAPAGYGIPATRSGLGNVPDDGSRLPQPVFFTELLLNGLFLQRSYVKLKPSCVTFDKIPNPGAIECVFHFKDISMPGGDFENAEIWWATTNAPPSFRLQSLGVAAPTPELVIDNVGNRIIATIADRPKAVTSLTCTKGPNFQSLCVASVVEAPANPFHIDNEVSKAFNRKKYRLAFKLVGTLGVAPPPPPRPFESSEDLVPRKPAIPSPPEEVAGPNKPGPPGPP